MTQTTIRCLNDSEEKSFLSFLSFPLLLLPLPRSAIFAPNNTAWKRGKEGRANRSMAKRKTDDAVSDVDIVLFAKMRVCHKSRPSIANSRVASCGT